MKRLVDFKHNRQTREQLTSNARAFADRRQPVGDLRPAAVVITVYEDEGQAAVMLTRRAGHLRAHGGQWALPGGRIDSGESAEQAALRELHEEVNLSLDTSHIIATLDDYITRSGYVITPVVVWSDVDGSHLVPNPGEVDSIHPFHFSELCRGDSPNLETIPQSERQVVSMNYQDDAIYAPTGAMLYQFREVAIFGGFIRVLDFEQPLFAWQ
ncbi:MAG: CoA pyrophosphatase [Halieaceae bacterium]|jgi:8-oxo-dGTP pyrophosphatase MutT (NUDIX family)|nr:CoA pyrophosphatase [Halieaceae bacterium]